MNTSLQEIYQTFSFLLDEKNSSGKLTALQQDELKSITHNLTQNLIGKELSVIVRVIDVLEDHIYGQTTTIGTAESKLSNPDFGKLVKGSDGYHYESHDQYLIYNIDFFYFAFVFYLYYEKSVRNQVLELSVHDFLRINDKITNLAVVVKKNPECNSDEYRKFYLRIEMAMKIGTPVKSVPALYTLDTLSLTPDEMVAFEERKQNNAILKTENEEEQRQKEKVERQKEEDEGKVRGILIYIFLIIVILLGLKSCFSQ